MRCFSCGHEASVVETECQDIANVRTSFELATVKCTVCGLTEKRLMPLRGDKPEKIGSVAPNLGAVLNRSQTLRTPPAPRMVSSRDFGNGRPLAKSLPPVRIPPPAAAPAPVTVERAPPPAAKLDAAAPPPVAATQVEPAEAANPVPAIETAPDVVPAAVPETSADPFEGAERSTSKFMEMVEAVKQENTVPQRETKASAPVAPIVPEISDFEALWSGVAPPAQPDANASGASKDTSPDASLAAVEKALAEMPAASPEHAAAEKTDKEDKALLKQLFGKIRITLRRT